MANQTNTCVYYDQIGQTVPLLLFQYQGRQYWICPQQLPILIHKSDQLADKLPDLGHLRPAEVHA